MELRNEIQKLAIWYIPIAIVSILAESWYAGFLKEAVLNGNWEPGSLMSSMMYVYPALRFSLALVSAIWLYYITSKTFGNKYVWFLFGLVANLLAVIIFICTAIYENTTSNNSFKL